MKNSNLGLLMIIILFIGLFLVVSIFSGFLSALIIYTITTLLTIYLFIAQELMENKDD